MATPPLKYLTVDAQGQHTATVIFIHVREQLNCYECWNSPLNSEQGCDETGHVWQPVASKIGSLPEFRHVKWVLPHA